MLCPIGAPNRLITVSGLTLPARRFGIVMIREQIIWLRVLQCIAAFICVISMFGN